MEGREGIEEREGKGRKGKGKKEKANLAKRKW